MNKAKNTHGRDKKMDELPHMNNKKHNRLEMIQVAR
jgi:hypothetical protein